MRQHTVTFMGNMTLKIDDLEKSSGVPRRNIRFLISEAVVPEPYSRGRGATYGLEHLEALKIYAQMKAQGVSSLGVIRDAIRNGEAPEFSVSPSPLEVSKTKTLNPYPGVEIKLDIDALQNIEISEVISQITTALKNLKEPSK